MGRNTMMSAAATAAALLLWPALAQAQTPAPVPVSAPDRAAPGASDICGGDPSPRFDIDVDVDADDAAETPSLKQLEDAARAFGERMEAFSAEADAVCADASLSDAQKEMRIAALWEARQPDLAAFTAMAAQLGTQIAAEVMADIDVADLVETAMVEAGSSGAVAGAMGMARNSAWTSGDPEHLETLELMAEYAAGEAADAMEAAAAASPQAPSPPATTSPAPSSPNRR